MKKKIPVLLALFLGIVMIISFKSYVTSYSRLTQDYVSISSVDVNNLKEGSIVYVGRKSCPYCRKFVPKLSDVSSYLNKKIYYVDTESEKKKSSENLAIFAKKYKVSGVPALLIKGEDNSITKIISEDITKKELEKIIMGE